MGKIALLLGTEVFLGADFVKTEWVEGAWHGYLAKPSPSSSTDGRMRAQSLPAAAGASPPGPMPPDVIEDIGVLISAGGFDCRVGKGLGMNSVEKKSKNALGVVCNFAKTNGICERKLRSFSMARLFYPTLFPLLARTTGADLENIVYTK